MITERPVNWDFSKSIKSFVDSLLTGHHNSPKIPLKKESAYLVEGDADKRLLEAIRSNK